jgi:hypothetical protein
MVGRHRALMEVSTKDLIRGLNMASQRQLGKLYGVSQITIVREMQRRGITSPRGQGGNNNPEGRNKYS